MKGTLTKFEPTKDDITIIIKCPKSTNMHEIVDLLNTEVNIGTGEDHPAYKNEQVLFPLLRMVQGYIDDAEKKGYEEGKQSIIDAEKREEDR